MKKKVLLIYTERIAFVREDATFLDEIAELTERPFTAHKNPILLLWELIKQFGYLLTHLRSFDTVYVWFADYHSFLPILIAKWYRRNSIIILGGYDTMALPQINYGVFLQHNLRRAMVAYSIRWAKTLLGVDESMFEGQNTYIADEPIAVGVSNFVNNIQGDCQVVPTGYDALRWQKDAIAQKENMVVSIGMVNELKGIQRKGFDFLIEVARQMPQYQFHIIGPSDDCLELLSKDAPENLVLHGFMAQEELKNYLDRAKIFCQFSLAEGLPNTLCEAMLCECIPVGSNVNGIPKAIDNPALVISKPNIELAEKAIEYAMHESSLKGGHFRDRIIEQFPKSKREKAIAAAL